MKLLAAILATFLPAQAAQGIDIARFVDAARAAENSPRHFISHDGARGCYQLKEITWSQYSKKPFEWATSDEPYALVETRRVALAHASWIVNSAIPSLNLSATVYTAALIWRKGYENVRKLNLTRENIDFAKRVCNLYESP